MYLLECEAHRLTPVDQELINVTRLMGRSNISPGTCCRRLRSAEVPSGRGPAGACCRSKGLCRGWDRPERRTEEQSGRVVAMGPQPRVHPSGVRTWVEEHEPEEGPADAWPAELSGKPLWWMWQCQAMGTSGRRNMRNWRNTRDSEKNWRKHGK
uniref:SCAN box domain-containing protein n=1 Tax=Oryzias latipes TaxID=8090 RepID=A0A3B3I0Z6_ORYLA